MSHFVHSDVIFELGNLHHGRKRVQPAGKEIREFLASAKSKLKFDLLDLTVPDRTEIAESFREAITNHRYTCYACAIMPDHIHILIRKHKHVAEDMIANLQEHSRLRLRTARLRTTDHPVWGGPGWKVFLDSPEDIRRTIRYIEDNPIKIRLPRQQWDFVTEYDGWPLHAGHDPNSPYARRLRGQGSWSQ
jgi:REP element-mobilizing transposase RayT